MSKLRRHLSVGITNNVETRNLDDIKAKTGNLYESISIIGKRANQINVSLKEELHNKLEEFASHTDSWKKFMKIKSKLKSQELMKECPIRHYWLLRSFG
jgi:hypothetical protein